MPADKSRDARRTDTRERLLKAAIRLLAERGYSGATTGRIAKAAGIKQPSFYAHFDSQDACLAEAIRAEGELVPRRLSRLREVLGDAGETPPEERLRRLVATLLGYIVQRPDVVRAASGLLDADNLAGEAVREALARIRDALLDELPSFGVTPPPDARQRMDMLIAMGIQCERGLRFGEYELAAARHFLFEAAGWLFGEREER